MTQEQIVKELEVQIETIDSMILYNKDFYPKQDITSLEERLETAKKSLTAINKQIELDAVIDNDNIICPSCNNILLNSFPIIKYCYHCGQKIKIGRI